MESLSISKKEKEKKKKRKKDLTKHYFSVGKQNPIIITMLKKPTPNEKILKKKKKNLKNPQEPKGHVWEERKENEENKLIKLEMD